MIFNYLCSIVLVLGVFTGEAIADIYSNYGDSEQRLSINRYTTSVASPTMPQRHLLSVIIQLRFPKDILTVGRAIEYALKNSGYRIANEEVDNSQYVLFGLPLPEVHRELGPMSLADVLITLANDGFELKENPIKRQLNFELDDKYRDALSPDVIGEAIERWLQEKSKANITNLYGPTKTGESLSTIARNMSFTNVSLEQVVVALFLANPNAFSHNNMNWLHKGVTLTIPNEKAMRTYSVEEAVQIVNEHEKKWLAPKGVTK